MDKETIINRILTEEEIQTELTEESLSEIYKAVKHSNYEEAVWKGLVFIYNKPLPGPIIMDLIDRRIAINELGHTKQEHEAMWKLAEMVDEALLTLAIDIYTQRSFGLEETERLLNKFYDHTWMLETLIRREPSSPAKRTRLEAALPKNKNSADLQRLLTVVDQVKLAVREDLTTDEYVGLLQTNEPQVWLALSRNPSMPVDMLQTFLKVKDIKHARRIRSSASETLRRKN